MSKVLLSILPILPLLLNRDAHESRAESKNIFEISNDITQRIFTKVLTSILVITVLVFALTRLALSAESYLIAHVENGQTIVNIVYFLILFGTLIAAYAIRAKPIGKSHHKETPNLTPTQLSLDKLLVEFLTGFNEGLNKKEEIHNPPPDNVYPYPGPSSSKRLQ